MTILHEFDHSKPVLVYRNLTKKCWSIKQGGRVVAHADWVVLEGCTFVVQQKGQERVRAERRKYVHAFVRGTLQAAGTAETWTEHYTKTFQAWFWDESTKEVRYNPYENTTFVWLHSNLRVGTTPKVYCGTMGKVWAAAA